MAGLVRRRSPAAQRGDVVDGGLGHGQEADSEVEADPGGHVPDLAEQCYDAVGRDARGGVVEVAVPPSLAATSTAAPLSVPHAAPAWRPGHGRKGRYAAVQPGGADLAVAPGSGTGKPACTLPGRWAAQRIEPEGADKVDDGWVVHRSAHHAGCEVSPSAMASSAWR